MGIVRLPHSSTSVHLPRQQSYWDPIWGRVLSDVLWSSEYSLSAAKQSVGVESILRIVSQVYWNTFSCCVQIFRYGRLFPILYWGADKALARPGNKHATATKLWFLQATQKQFKRLSVQPGLCGSNDLRFGQKMATFQLFFHWGRANDLSAPLCIFWAYAGITGSVYCQRLQFWRQSNRGSIVSVDSIWVNLGFCRGLNEVCDVLGFYAA